MKEPFKTETIRFQNVINEAGYDLKKGRDGALYLVMLDSPGKGLKKVNIGPGVFREFGGIERKPAGIVAFAEKYGNIHSVWPGVKDKHGKTINGTPISAWKDAIANMHAAVELWDCIQAENVEKLSKVIFQTYDGPEYSVSSRRGTHQRKLGQFRKLGRSDGPIVFSERDFILPARSALQKELNEQLATNPTTPELVWTEDTKKNGGHFQRIVFNPRNLLATMWLHFAYAVVGKFELKQCVGCGVYFQAGPGGSRKAGATYHSDACKVTTWQREHPKPKAKRKE